jgi:hypothetical protein
MIPTSNMTNTTLLGLTIPALIAVFSYQVACAYELAPLRGYSDQYNQGFSDGYIGTPLIGDHTHDYLTGYKNGTSSFQFNKGFAEGYSRIPLSHGYKTSDYLDGYKFGIKNRLPNDLHVSVAGQLPPTIITSNII